MRRIVLDASVTLALVLPGELQAAEAMAIWEAAKSAGFWAPPLWCSEVANALVVAARRQRISRGQYDAARVAVSLLDVTLDRADIATLLGPVSDIAVRHQLTVYDACYLELALRHSADLATFDAALRRAGQAVGVTIL